MGIRSARAIKIGAILTGAIAALGAAAASRAALPAANGYTDKACITNAWSARCHDPGDISMLGNSSTRAVFDALCPLPGPPGYSDYSDKDALFTISGSGQYHFDSYITMGYRHTVHGRVSYTYFRARLLVNGRFVTKYKTIGTYRVFKTGCRTIYYTWKGPY